jgi:outer membrane protein
MLNNKILFIMILFSLSLSAGILENAYEKGIENNRNIKIATSAVAFQSAVYENVKTLDSVSVQMDGYARYYLAQESALKDANFGLPDKSVVNDFVKANFNFSASKSLYNGSIDSQQELGHKGVQKAKDFFKQNKQDLVYDIAISYIEILRAYDALKLSKENLKIVNNEYKKSMEDSKVGVIDKVQLDVASAKTRCINALLALNLDQLNNAMDRFKMLTHYSVSEIKTLQENISYDSLYRKDFNTYYIAMLQTNPKLKQMQIAIEIAKEQVNLVDAMYDPSVQAQVGYEYTKNYTPVYIGKTYESGVYVGFSAVIPIYTGGRHDTATQKAIQNIQCETLKKTKVEQDMLLSLQKEYRQLLSTKIQIEASRSRVSSLKKLYEQAMLKMEIGQIKRINLSKIKYEYLESENELKEYQYRYFIARSNLEHLSGAEDTENLLLIDSLLNYESIKIENLKQRL